MKDIVGTKDKQFRSLGRNGTMYTIGLDVYIMNSTVCLTPINSKIELGRSRIELPIESIDNFIQLLQKAKDKSEFRFGKVWYDQNTTPPLQISESDIPF